MASRSASRMVWCDHLGAGRDAGVCDRGGWRRAAGACRRRRPARGRFASAGGALRGRWRRRCAAAPLRLALGDERRDRRVDLHLLGAVLDQQLRHRAFIDRFHLHGRLVGLDLGDDVAGFDRGCRSLTSHLASLPSSMVGERAGIRIWVGMVGSLFRCLDGQWSGNVIASNRSASPRHRECVQPVCSMEPTTSSWDAINVPESGTLRMMRAWLSMPARATNRSPRPSSK